MEEFGCHKADGLLQRCLLVQPLSRMDTAAVLGCAANGHVDGLRLLPSKVVVDGLREAGPR